MSLTRHHLTICGPKCSPNTQHSEKTNMGIWIIAIGFFLGICAALAAVTLGLNWLRKNPPNFLPW
jgi:hypothetical protein